MAQGNLLQLTVKRLYVVIRRTEAWLIILEHRYTLIPFRFIDGIMEYAEDTLLTGDRRRSQRTEGTRKVPSLYPPLPTRQDARAPQVRGAPQPRGGRPGVGLQLAPVPEV